MDNPITFMLVFFLSALIGAAILALFTWKEWLRYIIYVGIAVFCAWMLVTSIILSFAR